MLTIASFPNFARYDSSFAIIRDYEDGSNLDYITIDEERLLRKKNSFSFPLLSMQYCFDYFGIKSFDEIDYVVTDYSRFPSLFNDGPGYRKLEHDYLKGIIDFPKEKIIYINHHFAHAAGVFKHSNFEEAAILVVDGMGSELETQSLFYGYKNGIKLIEKAYCWGIGSLYSNVTTNLLGFVGNNGVDQSGKTMGLAPYGRNIKGNILEINSTYNGLQSDYSSFISRYPKPKIKQKNLVPCKDASKVTNEYYSRIAYDLQKETEKAILKFANYAFQKTNSKNLCLSGGVALNSVANGKIINNTPFSNLFVTPACSDTGIPLHLCLSAYYYRLRKNKKAKFVQNNAYLGKNYEPKVVEELLVSLNLNYEKRDIKKIAEEISNQKIIAWFIGGSEIGPRALGHRSILVDPRNPEMKNILNSKIKHREKFRPFAPAILEEKVNEYFMTETKANYMLEVHPIRPEKINKIPATAHVDGTGRLQTVNKEDSPEYYSLINEFYKITGVPVLLNTSFNDNEPIVETPEDSIITLLNTNIDILVIDNFVIYKNLISESKRIKLINLLKDQRKLRISNNLIKIKKRYFKNYSKEESKKFLINEEKRAEWHLKHKPLFELNKFIRESSKKDRVIIIGTIEHTKFIYERLYEISKLNIIGFIPWRNSEKNPDIFRKFKKLDLENLNKQNFEYILISSHEYFYEIKDFLEKLKINEKKLVEIYDTASDTMLENSQYLPIYNKNN